LPHCWHSAPLHASADQFADTYGYVGASVGNAKVKADPADVRFSEWDTSWKVFAGYMFNENIGAEIGYHDMGSPDDSGFEVSELTAFTSQVIGVLPLGQFDLFAKVGLAYYDAEFEYAMVARPPGTASNWPAASAPGTTSATSRSARKPKSSTSISAICTTCPSARNTASEI
jgi:hypothetical protein